jgi:hypothetical protein
VAAPGDWRLLWPGADSLETIIANKQGELSDEHLSLEANQADLKNEKDYEKSIKPDCDWILKAFQTRADQRKAEMNGLVGAKEFLAGYQPAAELVQKKAGFLTKQ